MAAKLIHKSSSVQYKNVRPNQIEHSEIAVNYHESGPYLQVKDSDGAIVQVGGIFIGTAAPTNPIPGKMWLNNVAGNLYIYDGTSWINVSV